MRAVKATTIIRTAILIFSLANQLLAIFGKEVLPFTEDQLYQAVSACMTVLSSLVAWWKNNSFTEHAILADAYLQKLKETAYE